MSVLTHTIFSLAFVLIQKQTKIKALSFGKYRFRIKRLKMKRALRVDRHSSGPRKSNSLRKAVHLYFNLLNLRYSSGLLEPKILLLNAASGEAA